MVFMYLVLNNKSKFYQLIYLRCGKRTSVSTGTTNKKEAQKFLTSFNPDEKPVKEKKIISISLSFFIKEYKSYVEKTYSIKYLKKAVVPSFNRLQNYIDDKPLDQISSRDIDHFISSVYVNAKYAASLIS